MADPYWIVASVIFLSIFALLALGIFFMQSPSSEVPKCKGPDDIALALTQCYNKPIVYTEDGYVRTIDPSIIVVDACNWSSWTLYLLTSGEIYIYDDDSCTHFVKLSFVKKSSASDKSCVRKSFIEESLPDEFERIKLGQIVSFGESIYGTSGGMLYKLKNVDDSFWTWVMVDWTECGIKYISTTMTDSHLYVWYGNVGKIYSLSKASGCVGTSMRTYGQNVDWYVIFENGSTVHPINKHYNDEFGLIDFYGNFYPGKQGEMVTINYMVYRLKS